MTDIENVADLIEALSAYPPDTPVRIQARAGQSRRSVRAVQEAGGSLDAVVVMGW